MLAGKRVLIVEDEYFIASDIRRTLVKEGVAIVGPVGNLAAGMALALEPIDVAILDVNLEEALSYPLADRLRDRQIPYMFLTGYDGWSLPDAYRDVPRLAKPFPSSAVIAMVVQLVAAAEIGPA